MCASSMQLLEILGDSTFAIGQELLVTLIFVMSLFFWRNVGRLADPRPRSSPKQHNLACNKTTNAIPKVVREDPLVNDKGEANVPREDTKFSMSAASMQLRIKSAEVQMLNLLKGREFTRAINMYRTFEKSGRDHNFTSEALFGAFIQSAIRMDKTDVVERMMRTMNRNGITPSLDFWQATMKLLSSRKQFTVCLSTYALYGKTIPYDKVVYSCLINAALEVDQPAHAVSMLNNFKQADIDTNDHILFFRTYVAVNDLESAEAIFEKLGAQMTCLMLNLLLSICVNSSKPERAWEHLCKAHDLEKDYDCKGKIVDRISYNTVLKGFALSGQPRRSFDCLFQMRDYGLEPDDITLSTFVDTCIIDDDFGAPSQIVDLLMSGERRSDTLMCTLFVKGLLRMNCFSKALELYDTMKKHEGCHPDVITYSVLIKASADHHDLDNALKLVNDMKASGLQPDDIILTHLLEGCRHASNLTLGKKLFEELVANGVTPSEFTLVTMLKLYGRCGSHNEAHDLVATWEKTYGRKPSVIHYTCLMSGCLRTKNYAQAWAAYDLMCQNDIAADETSLSTLLPGMVAAQRWDNVVMLVKRSLQGPTPIALPAEALNNALSQMLALDRKSQLVDELRLLMQTAKVPITTRREYQKR